MLQLVIIILQMLQEQTSKNNLLQPYTHLTFTCSKLTIKILESGVKYVQSYQ